MPGSFPPSAKRPWERGPNAQFSPHLKFKHSTVAPINAYYSAVLPSGIDDKNLDKFNPFTPKVKKYNLPTFYREMYE